MFGPSLHITRGVELGITRVHDIIRQFLITLQQVNTQNLKTATRKEISGKTRMLMYHII